MFLQEDLSLTCVVRPATTSCAMLCLCVCAFTGSVLYKPSPDGEAKQSGWQMLCATVQGLLQEYSRGRHRWR